MKLQTKFLGEIEIDDSKVISFDEGIPAFEDNHKFLLLSLENKTPIMCLQSIDNKDLCLILINPFDYFKDYEIELYDEDILKLGINSENEVIIYNVITIREDKITANLVAPIIINIKNNKAKQIVFSNLKYDVRQEIPCLY